MSHRFRQCGMFYHPIRTPKDVHPPCEANGASLCTELYGQRFERRRGRDAKTLLGRMRATENFKLRCRIHFDERI
jgi:hypothetical protein